MNFLGSRFPFFNLRRIFRPAEFIRQNLTKSYRFFCKNDLEKLKKLTLHSVYLTYWCPPPGIPLSAIRMEVSKGPSLEIGKLAPSLVQFLEAATTNGCQDDRPKCEAFEVLENALAVLSNPESRFGLRWEVLGILDELLLKRSAMIVKERKTFSEETVNVAIVSHILMHLTRGIFILNKGHSRVPKYPKRTYLPETFRWDGLALGHRNAWYGELDMIVCPFITGEPQPKVGVLWEKSYRDHLDDAYWEEDDIEEEFSGLVVPDASIAIEEKKNIPKSWSLFGSHFSQGYATAVTFSYVYHHTLSETQSARSSLLPTVQISPRGYQIFLYDCLQDVMFANNFFWSRESLIYLWAFLHHHLFFPTNLDPNEHAAKFGYDKSSGFYVNRSELLFGLNLNSPHWKKDEPVEGRMM